MEWLTRFFLGLYPRPQDLESIKKHFPELLDSKQILDPRKIPLHDLLLLVRSDDILQKIREWVSNAETYKGTNSRTRNNCTLGECLFAKEKTNEIDIDEASEPEIFKLMSAGGGLNRKNPLRSFLDIVKEVHKKQKKHPNRVLITDPYLYSEVSARGNPVGLENLILYLSELKIEKHSKFTLVTTNKPKKGTFKNFKELINTKFPNAIIEKFKTENLFHDRFYIALYEGGNTHGVFGPSLSGLTDNDIVLMGEIEEKALIFLKKIIDRF